MQTKPSMTFGATGYRQRPTAVIVLVCTMSFLASCEGESQKQQKAAAEPKSVTVIQPKTADVPRYLYETGTTKALDSVDLTARVTGYLKSIDYKDGAKVQAGQRLFLIEPDQYEAQLQQAQATAEQAQATLDNAEVQLKRQEELLRSSTTTQANADNARASRDEAQAQRDSAKASLREAQINLGYTSVNAPFDGFVTEHQASVGALVGSGGPTTLATIVKLDPMHVSFSISDTDMLQIRKQIREKGMTPKALQDVPVEAATKIDKDFPFKGKLDYIAPQTDAESGTLAVRAVFDNGSRDLLPNLFLRLRIPMGTVKDGLLVPPSAIGTDQQGRFVLVVRDDGLVERRTVTLLERSADLQQVEGALAANDNVVLNATAVKAGESAKIQQPAPSKSAADGTQQGNPAPASN